jgi:23S rRNA (cytidine1920-2'-O)/16S rRNA (cytidine1409-2'-O)-methyltransferase
MPKQRLDTLLVDRALCSSRQQAQRLIQAGEVRVNQQLIDKPGTEVEVTAEVEVKARSRFVSRGGEKIAKALTEFQIRVSDRICLDGGISTGGFTDCLLQSGAKLVYGIDVGYGQVAWNLRQDERVILRERTNIRHLKPEELYAENQPIPDLAVVDVSFISLTKILPALWELLQAPRELVLLVKPQFEVGKDRIGKKGVVRDSKDQASAIAQVLECAKSLGWFYQGLTWSPLLGPAGNIEFLLWLQCETETESPELEQIKRLTQLGKILSALVVLSKRSDLGTLIPSQTNGNSMQSMSLNRRSMVPMIVIAALLSIGGLVTLLRTLTVVSTGEIGITDLYGQVSDQPLTPGIHFKNPMARMVTFSSQTREFKETLQTPTKEGLMLNVDVSVLYRIDPAKAKQLYQTVGMNYEEIVLVPQVRSLIRSATANFESKTIYTSDRQTLAQQLRENLNKTLSDRGIIIEDTPIRNVKLPDSVEKSVQEKLSAEQDAQRMKFVLDRERQEADRKRIEAQGNADAQKILSQGLSEQALRFKQIEAMQQLAQNSKVIVMGGDQKAPVMLQP